LTRRVLRLLQKFVYICVIYEASLQLDAWLHVPACCYSPLILSYRGI
jgi:hypothetical protein